MEVGTVRQIDINQEMQDSYLDYAMSVIVARALPDVRDGLKPVHRRILYAMYDMKLTPDKPYRKSARIVGEVLGKYHPHGDAAVYESMVRMAQDFSMRYPLVDGQGNFGSIDGDAAAAMRYTEARLRPIAMEMLADIERETVPFGPNFDGTLEEPLVLPSAIPNFLVNGASGIAVGMATNVPPHNLGEVCDALAYIIDHYADIDDITVQDLMRFIKGPDFPTGGIVYRYSDSPEGMVDVIQAAYAVGRGRFTVQARAHFEPMSRGRNRIVVTELPYQTNKVRLIERIAVLVREGRLDGVADLRDESDRQGMRLVIELTRSADPAQILDQLYQLTPMQSTFSVNLLALVDGEPRTLSLKRALFHYLEHRREVVRRRSEYDLERARRHAHILEGLLIALDNLDEVIATIRSSRSAETAQQNLMRKFKLSEVQAQAILDMPLRRLAALEQKKIREDYQDTLAKIAYLESLLADPQKMLTVIKEELLDIKARYGDARRTQLVESESRLSTARELVQEEDVLIAVSGGRVWREPLAERRRGTAVGLGREGLDAVAIGPTTGDVLFFTADGRAGFVPVHRVPEHSESAVGAGQLLNTTEQVRIRALVALPPPESVEDPESAFVVMASQLGKIKRTTLKDIYSLAGRGLSLVMGISEDDQLVDAAPTRGDEPLMLLTSDGLAICFAQDEVRPMGLPAAGVSGIKLSEGACVVGLGVVRPGSEVVVVTERGYAKRTPADEFPLQKRYGGGVLALRVNSRIGEVAGGGVLMAGDELWIVTGRGEVKGLTPARIPALRRPAQPQECVSIAKTDVVAAVKILPRAEIERGGPVEEEKTPARAVKPSGDDVAEEEQPVAVSSGTPARTRKAKAGAESAVEMSLEETPAEAKPRRGGKTAPGGEKTAAAPRSKAKQEPAPAKASSSQAKKKSTPARAKALSTTEEAVPPKKTKGADKAAEGKRQAEQPAEETPSAAKKTPKGSAPTEKKTPAKPGSGKKKPASRSRVVTSVPKPKKGGGT